MAVSRYISKNFGKYELEICKKTNYFNALHLLNVYNDSFEKQKIVKMMIRFLKGDNFTKQLNSDFNHIVEKNLLDYEYLNDLIETMKVLKISSSQVTEKTPPCEIKELSEDLKYKYMVRKVELRYNNILSLDIHPMLTIRLSMWLSPVLGNIILTHIKINCPNDLIFTDGSNTTVRLEIPKLIKIDTEKIISDRISKEENGEREIYMKNTGHRIDVLTEEYIIEVKTYSNRIKAIGQVFYYRSDYPNKKLWIHLFDHNDHRDKTFELTCKNNDIKLTYEN
jgi:hypothetical protein